MLPGPGSRAHLVSFYHLAVTVLGLIQVLMLVCLVLTHSPHHDFHIGKEMATFPIVFGGLTCTGNTVHSKSSELPRSHSDSGDDGPGMEKLVSSQFFKRRKSRQNKDNTVVKEVICITLL